MQNDHETWERACVAATVALSNLSPAERASLASLISEIMKLKRSMVELVTAAGSSEVCRTCGGECCLLGKFHVSVLDILAYHVTGVAPVAPDFGSHPACPYSGGNGCLMPPGYRPVTCVIFNCQPVENLLTPAGLDSFSKLETSLRAAVTAASRICGARIDRPLLLSGS